MRILPAILLAFAPVAAFAQAVPGDAPDIPAAKDNSQEEFLKDAEVERGASQQTDREARLSLEAFGQCVAKASPGEAARVLAMDFTSTKYRTGLKLLADSAQKSCASKAFGRGKMRTPNLLFAGELAEALVKSDATPAAARLARAAGAPATPSYSFTDKVAICVVRSVPDQVAALFDTQRDSADEAKAIEALAVPAGLCAKAAEAKKPLAINPAGLRAMLATAAFRLIKSSEVPA